MKRLLCMLSCMNAGGAETFLMKIYRNLDRTQYQLDFCINVQEKCFYEDEILSLGGKIYRIPSKSENVKEFKRQLAEIIKNEGYDYVLRITSNAMGFMDLKIAKKAGARVCCARSSNASDGGGFKKLAVHHLGKIFYNRYVDVKIAPSDLAAKYTFGDKAYRAGEVKILHNAVDMDTFCFCEEARRAVRNEFNIEDNTKLIGHVGRFASQKNHAFLADVFNEIYKLDSNTKLMLVGDGPLKAEFEDKIAKYGLSDYVIFAGIRADVPRLLSAMDVFVFPSFYEGMPNTVIEAQATGLPCVISDTITREANITGLVDYLSLEDAKHWAQSAIAAIKPDRTNTRDSFIKNKYDIQSVVDEFVKNIFVDLELFN